MSATNITGTILIREKTLLPASFAVQTEAAFPGWQAVRNLDGYELGRKMEQANWNFFCLAGAIRTIVFGGNGQKTVHQAVSQILTKLDGKQFNSLEITGVIEKRFLGIPFLSVTANSRHIQESVYLVPIDNRASRIAAALAPSVTLHRGEVLAKQDAALV
jgi:hypothetical protein